MDTNQLGAITLYLERIPVPVGHVLWTQGAQADGLYIIQSGLLKASYKFENAAQDFEETMVAGTVAGELSTIADTRRNCTVVVEQAGVLWKMGRENLHRLQLEQPELARVFVQFALKGACGFVQSLYVRCDLADWGFDSFAVAATDYDILLTAMASRQ